jgi:hypothetical protein
MPEPESQAAANWLIAEFDATDPADTQLYHYDRDTDAYWQPVIIQPMFTLKPDDDVSASEAMHVVPSDYHDQARWWL